MSSWLYCATTRKQASRYLLPSDYHFQTIRSDFGLVFLGWRLQKALNCMLKSNCGNLMNYDIILWCVEFAVSMYACYYQWFTYAL